MTGYTSMKIAPGLGRVHAGLRVADTELCMVSEVDAFGCRPCAKFKLESLILAQNER